MKSKEVKSKTKNLISSSTFTSHFSILIFYFKGFNFSDGFNLTRIFI